MFNQISRKWLCWILALALVVSSCAIISCSDDEDGTGNGPTQTPEQKVYTFKMQNAWTGIGMPINDLATERFIERVEEMSGGQIIIANYNSDELVPTFELLDAVGRGTVDMAVVAPLYWVGKIGQVGNLLFQISFTLQNYEEFLYYWYEQGVVDLWNDIYEEYNVHLVAPMLSDEYGSIMSTVPITSLEDFEGLKIRASGDIATMLADLGASIVSLPVGDVYTGLSLGNIEAALFFSPGLAYGMKLHEVAPYYLDPPSNAWNTIDMMINLDTWNSLPEDLQAVLEAAARVHSNDYAALTIEQDALGREALAAEGVTFNKLSNEDIEWMKDRLWEIALEHAAEQPEAADVLEAMENTLEMSELYYSGKRW